jgi:hypothetical protein
MRRRRRESGRTSTSSGERGRKLRVETCGSVTGSPWRGLCKRGAAVDPSSSTIGYQTNPRTGRARAGLPVDVVAGAGCHGTGSPRMADRASGGRHSWKPDRGSARYLLGGAGRSGDRPADRPAGQPCPHTRRAAPGGSERDWKEKGDECKKERGGVSLSCPGAILLDRVDYLDRCRDVECLLRDDRCRGRSGALGQ